MQRPLQGGEFLRADLATDKGKVVIFSVLRNRAVKPSIINLKIAIRRCLETNEASGRHCAETKRYLH